VPDDASLTSALPREVPELGSGGRLDHASSPFIAHAIVKVSCIIDVLCPSLHPISRRSVRSQRRGNLLSHQARHLDTKGNELRATENFTVHRWRSPEPGSRRRYSRASGSGADHSPDAPQKLWSSSASRTWSGLLRSPQPAVRFREGPWRRSSSSAWGRLLDGPGSTMAKEHQPHMLVS
jgi:hypothetical protein